MIIGSGFIAKNFENCSNELERLSVCLYAAGVSNSQIKDNDLLVKEKDRLIDFSKKFNQEKKLVYISTCSINDTSRNKTPYVKNKLEIENLIVEKFNKFLIIRFPEVVGKNDNSITLTNFLYHNIINQKKFEMWKNAKRNLIDIQDAILLTVNYLKNKKSNKIVNIANPINCYVSEIVKNFEILSNIKANYNLVDKGYYNLHIDVSEISEIITNNQILFDQSYLHKILKKYYF